MNKRIQAFKDYALHEAEGEQLLSFAAAYEQFIEGQVVTGVVEYHYNSSVGNIADQPHGYGLTFGNGYKYISHGGGCGGEDCNVQMVLDVNNTIIARNDFTF